MPIFRRHDVNGYYYQFGNHGHKYYYTPNVKRSRELAREKARRQAAAIYSTGWRE